MMLNRLAVLVTVLLVIGVVPASAQYTVVDANGAVVGSVIGQLDRDPFPALVATQDGNGLWLWIPVLGDGLPPLDVVGPDLVYYTDTACATTPYLRISGVFPLAPPPLFRRVEGSGAPGIPGYYYSGDPLIQQTFQSRSIIGRPNLCTSEQNGPFTVGPLTTFDLSQFVPPLRVQ
jgi:hypothetical protein